MFQRLGDCRCLNVQAVATDRSRLPLMSSTPDEEAMPEDEQDESGDEVSSTGRAAPVLDLPE